MTRPGSSHPLLISWTCFSFQDKKLVNGHLDRRGTGDGWEIARREYVCLVSFYFPPLYKPEKNTYAPQFNVIWARMKQDSVLSTRETWNVFTSADDMIMMIFKIPKTCPNNFLLSKIEIKFGAAVVAPASFNFFMPTAWADGWYEKILICVTVCLDKFFLRISNLFFLIYMMHARVRFITRHERFN